MRPFSNLALPEGPGSVDAAAALGLSGEQLRELQDLLGGITDEVETESSSAMVKAYNLSGPATIMAPEMLRALMESTLAFGLYFFPEHFTREFSSLHSAIAHFTDDDTVMKAGLAAPRGYGKTTLLQVAHIARKALFGQSKFIVTVSCTYTQASMHISTLRVELECNEKITSFFGDVKGNKWSNDELILKNGTYILPRGSGQQIRGLKYRQNRPDLIICDDLEDTESVANPDLRKKLKRWFYTDLMRAGKGTGLECKIIFIGTILHEDSLLENVLSDPNWASVRLEAFNDRLEPTDENFLSSAAVQALFMEYEAKGLLDELYMEYRNLATAPQNRIFPTVYHKYSRGDAIWDIVTRDILNGRLATCVICDPAKTTNASSDYSSCVGLAIDFAAGIIYVHEVFSGRIHPDKLIATAFDMCDRLNTTKLFIETTSLHEWLTTVVRSVMLGRVQAGSTKLYDVTELHSTIKSKEDRIGKLAPLYKAGMIMHNAHVTRDLEAQLMAFPKSKFDDIMDALAYLIPIISMSSGWDYKSLDDLFTAHSWGPETGPPDPDDPMVYAYAKTINQSRFQSI